MAWTRASPTLSLRYMHCEMWGNCRIFFHFLLFPLFESAPPVGLEHASVLHGSVVGITFGIHKPLQNLPTARKMQSGASKNTTTVQGQFRSSLAETLWRKALSKLTHERSGTSSFKRSCAPGSAGFLSDSLSWDAVSSKQAQAYLETRMVSTSHKTHVRGSRQARSSMHSSPRSHSAGQFRGSPGFSTAIIGWIFGTLHGFSDLGDWRKRLPSNVSAVFAQDSPCIGATFFWLFFRTSIGESNWSALGLGMNRVRGPADVWLPRVHGSTS